MKVRNGFVSNSSSSSFIISKNYDMNKVLEYAKSIIYKEKQSGGNNWNNGYYINDSRRA